jgi:hypothetical protein
MITLYTRTIIRGKFIPLNAYPKMNGWPDDEAHICNLNTQESEIEELQVQGQMNETLCQKSQKMKKGRGRGGEKANY